MSYDIYMVDPATLQVIEFDESHQFIGGTYAAGGTTEAWLNITWNYGVFYRETIDLEKGIRWIYGKTGAECLPVLEKARDQLGVEKSSDYWELTEGNAGHALIGLIAFCKARPDGIFKGD
uniref:Uncharacterized protein n=1 Tax=viral metagenome TaxID=1070528 RepID=A0A6M3X6K3_9ZZZZ